MTQPPRLYLGIDGGQSSTTTLIADETGRILGQGRGGPCNHVSVGEGRAKFLSAVGDSLGQACQAAGLDSTTVTFAAACLGFSGGAEDKEAYSRELIRSDVYKITHDAEIALTGATAGAPGMIIIAGTGSMGFGRNEEGRTARAGGWGYVFGDEGGGFDIVRRALRAVLQEEEGWGPATKLTGALLQATRATSANDLLHRFYTPAYPRSTVAQFAPLVDEVASSGDAVAEAVLRSAAAELFAFVRALHINLFRSSVGVPVAMIGAVFHSNIFREEFSRLVDCVLHCNAIHPQYSPAAGAVLEALRVDHRMVSLSEVPAASK